MRLTIKRKSLVFKKRQKEKKKKMKIVRADGDEVDGKESVETELRYIKG